RRQPRQVGSLFELFAALLHYPDHVNGWIARLAQLGSERCKMLERAQADATSPLRVSLLVAGETNMDVVLGNGTRDDPDALRPRFELLVVCSVQIDRERFPLCHR